MTILKLSEYIKEKYLTDLDHFTVNNLNDLRILHDRLIQIRVELMISNGFGVMPHYRGEQKYGWDIIPGILRLPFGSDLTKENVRDVELNGSKLFKEKVSEIYGIEQLFPLNSRTEHDTNWDILFQAQHAGVRTSLIDLSTNVSLAAFFACEPTLNFNEHPGQIWGILVPTDLILNDSNLYKEPTYTDYNPYNLSQSFVCNVPTYIDDLKERIYQMRLFRQHGRLFASADDEIDIPLNKREFWKNLMFRVNIKPEIKRIIFQELIQFGTTKESLVLEDSDVVKAMISYINDNMKTL